MLISINQSSSLSGPSGESGNGRHGRYDGLGALGLPLRKFLAFVFELWVSFAFVSDLEAKAQPPAPVDYCFAVPQPETEEKNPLTTFFTLANADPASFPALQSSLLYPGPMTVTWSMTTIFFPSHLVGNILLIASNISCASLVTVLLTLLAFSCARCRATAARAWEAVVERYGRGAGTEGGGERMAKVVIDERGRTWWVVFAGLVERATRWVRGQIV